MDPRRLNRLTGLQVAMGALSMMGSLPTEARQQSGALPPCEPPLPKSARSSGTIYQTNTLPPPWQFVCDPKQSKASPTWVIPTAHRHTLTGPSKVCATCHKRLTGEELREARRLRAVACSVPFRNRTVAAYTDEIMQHIQNSKA